MWVEPGSEYARRRIPGASTAGRQALVRASLRRQRRAHRLEILIPSATTWQLPQIYKKSGVDYFVTQKMTWNDTNQLPFKLFWWESPDGSKVLAYASRTITSTPQLNPSPTRRRSQVCPRAFYRSHPDARPLWHPGDHGGGATRSVLDEGFHSGGPESRYADLPVWHRAVLLLIWSKSRSRQKARTWDYQSIAKGYTAPPPVPNQVSIPTWKSELYFEYHRGVMTSQANHKRNMRDAEEQVLNAEKWASLAWLDGKNYPAEEITEDWKKVLFQPIPRSCEAGLLASASFIRMLRKTTT